VGSNPTLSASPSLFPPWDIYRSYPMVGRLFCWPEGAGGFE